MWKDTRKFSELQTRGRWKVEFFSGDATRRESVYPQVLLSELVSERKETLNPQEHSKRQFNFIGLENIESDTGDLVDFEPSLGAKVKSRSKIFCDGDVLYGRLRPNLNKVYASSAPVSSGICSGEFYVLISDGNKVRPVFLRALLASCFVQDHVGEWLTGAALPRLQLSDLLGLKVPLPPIQVQDELVAFITACDERRRFCKRIVADLPSFVDQTLLANLLSGDAVPSATELRARLG